MIGLIFSLIACDNTEPKINRIEPDLAIAITSLDFGEVKVNENSTQTFQIINAGAATLRLTSLELLDNVDNAYSLDMVVIGQSETNLLGDTIEIQPSDIANLTVQFGPTEFQDYNRALQISSNDPEQAEYSLPITGVGGDGPMPDIAVDNLTLDFGSVQVGQAPLLYFTVQNQGDADLEISGTTQTGSGAFSVVGDLDQKTLAPGVQTAIVVNYTPFQENGDSGSITITSNDPDQPSIEIQFIGNGGGENSYPVADIICPSNVEAPTQISFNGSGSMDPNAETLTYNWSLIKKPIGSVTTLQNATAESSILDVDLAGDYQVNLTVNNQSGFQSAPAECLFYAEPPSDIHVELSWNDPDADLDLHLTKAADGLFSLENDCCWCNPNPDWGDVGPDDDPILNADSADNSVPEIIDIASAADGDYYVRVHYFSDLGAGDVQATVRVYVSGVLEGQYTQQLIHNQAWEVGFVRWPLGLLAEESLPPSAYSGIRSCQ